MSSQLNYSEIDLEDLERSVAKHKKKEAPPPKCDKYASYERDSDGLIAAQNHSPKHKPLTTA